MLGADHHRAAASHQRQARAGAAEDFAARREIRARHDVQQIEIGDVRIVDHRHRRIDHFRQIVRRNVRRHADGDAAAAIDQQVRKPRRQHRRLLHRAVVIVLEIDRAFVDVVQQRARGLRQARFGVAHRRRHIAVDRTEIALPIDERQAHREVLRQAHQRQIDRLVAVRVIVAHHFADGVGALAVALVVRVARLIHRVEDAPVHGLQAVARIRQRARDDDAHRVVEIRALQLVFDADERDAFGKWTVRRSRRDRTCLTRDPV